MSGDLGSVNRRLRPTRHIIQILFSHHFFWERTPLTQGKSGGFWWLVSLGCSRRALYPLLTGKKTVSKAESISQSPTHRFFIAIAFTRRVVRQYNLSDIKSSLLLRVLISKICDFSGSLSRLVSEDHVLCVVQPNRYSSLLDRGYRLFPWPFGMRSLHVPELRYPLL